MKYRWLNEWVQEHKDEHEILVSRREFRTIKLFDCEEMWNLTRCERDKFCASIRHRMRVVAGWWNRYSRYDLLRDVFILERKPLVRREIRLFAEAMEKVMQEKQIKYGEEWKQLSTEELAQLSLEHLDEALDNDDDTARFKHKMIHAGNYAMMAWNRGDA